MLVEKETIQCQYQDKMDCILCSNFTGHFGNGSSGPSHMGENLGQSGHMYDSTLKNYCVGKVRV